MVEPITLTVLATSIVGFVFTAASTTVIERATEATLEKLNILRQKVMDKLNLKPKAKAELEKTENIDLEVIKTYLHTAMMDDDEFAAEVKSLVEDINKDLEEAGQGSNIMYVYGGKAYQQNQNKGNIYNADTINIHG
jgi:hypothetical protein